MHSSMRLSAGALLTLVVFLVWASLPLFAQEFRSTLTGIVTDPSGSVVPDAAVQATNKSTQQSYTAKTNKSGSFYIPYVLPGTYTVTVTATGFQKQVQDSVLLQASQSLALNFKMSVGATTTTVEVTGAPPLLENATGSGNTILSEREIENVPLNGRQVYMLIGTTPGSQFTQTSFGPGGYSGTRGWDNSNAYTIGGSTSNYNQFNLNGTNVTVQTGYQTQGQGTWEIAPNVDALQEVNVMTTTYDARFGRSGGGIVNMVMKSGTNQFHGTAYDYLENGVLNANYFENNLNNLPRPEQIQNQFGGTVGGPIKKDKIFFFASFEGYKEKIPGTILESVPPAYMRPTSAGANFGPSGYDIYDPSTTVCTVAGGTLGNCPNNAYARTMFLNDTIPASRISPIGAAILNLYPVPNTNVGALTNNYIANIPDIYNYYQPMGRLDYNTSDSTRWYTSFAYQRGTEFRNQNGFPPPAEQGNINQFRGDVTATQDMTHTFSPTLVGDFKLSFSRFVDYAPNGDLSAQVSPTTLGLNMPQVPTTTLKLLPQITFSELYPQAVGNQDTRDAWTQTIFDSDFTKVIRNHTVHFGGEVGYYQFGDPGTIGSPNGYFNFGTDFTQYNPLSRGLAPNGISDGFTIADLLLGYPDSNNSGLDNNGTINEDYPAWDLYVQDDWKVNHRLTINVGLRYDVQVGVREHHNQLNRGLCLTCVNPITSDPAFQANLAADAPALTAAGINPSTLTGVYGGVLFAGAGGQSQDAYNTDWSNIGPRFGFAYQVNPKTVVRGGWGLMYAIGLEGGSNEGYSLSTPYIASLNGGVTPTNYFMTGTPFPSGILSPPGASGGLLTGVGSEQFLDFPGRRIPRSQVFSLGFQRELPGGMVLDARYAANYTDRLRVFVWLDGTATRQMLNQALANPNVWSQQVPNPYYNVPSVPSSSGLGSSPTVAAIDLMLPLSQYAQPYGSPGVGEYNDPLGKTFYNALEVKLNKRLYGGGAHGLSFQLAYTYSKTMQATGYQNGWPYQDPSLKYEIAGTDRTHVLAFTGVWNLPIGRGSKYILTNAHGFVGELVNDWNLGFVLSAQTGFPVTLDNSGVGYTCSHSYTPDGGPTLAQWIYNNNGNPLGCFTPFTNQWELNYLPDQIATLRQPSVPNLDLSLEKNFAMTESLRLQLRADAFNITNSVLFPGPNNNPFQTPSIQNGIPTGFGTVNLFQQNFPRVIQLAAKVFF